VREPATGGQGVVVAQLPAAAAEPVG
jgi:hypothetical protein